MKLHYFIDPKGLKNFGDDLNPWMWKKLIPNMLDDEADTLFIGIGTLLNGSLPQAKQTVVFGSGVGYGQVVPEVNNTWKIYCLRGPLSAKALSVSSELAITDPAMLVSQLVDSKNIEKIYKFSYMPHCANANPVWESVCKRLGYKYISPTWDVERVLSDILHTEVLITEALHGAIVADALRVPWIPIETTSIVLSFKWNDWCSSIGVKYEPNHLMPLWRLTNNAGAVTSLRSWAKTKMVAAKLSQIEKNTTPNLSQVSHCANLIMRLQEQLEQFKSDKSAGLFSRSQTGS